VAREFKRIVKDLEPKKPDPRRGVAAGGQGRADFVVLLS
jgi:hypothetical protein